MENKIHEKSKSPEVPLIICGTCMVAATSLINANAFPKELEKEISAASTKFSLFLNARINLINSVELAYNEMFEHLKRNWIQYKQACTKRQDIEFVAYSDGITYMSNFHFFLYEFKAFLDIFAKIICRLNDKDSSPVHGFNKGNYEGRTISGGKLINWVSKRAKGKTTNRDVLLRILRNNCSGWITETVKYRDDLAHYKGIKNFQHMRISVTRGPEIFQRECILEPTMPNGVGIIEYSRNICNNLGQFIEDILSINSKVKNELNTTWKKALTNSIYKL